MMILVINVSAQTADSTLNKWIPSLVGGLKFSQIAFSNWTKGGSNSITWTVVGDFNLLYNSENGKFKTQLKAEYGRAKLGSKDFQTNENELFLEQVYSYAAGWKVDPFISNSIRTQITDGYDYEKSPPQKTAGFFDPAYITQSLGFTFNREKVFQTRLGLAFQETITDKHRMHTDLKSTPHMLESFKFETGIESVTNAKFNFDNLTAKSDLRLFTRFEHIDVVDIRWDNTITAKINSWFNVSFTYNLIFNKAESLSTQMKEAMQMGVVYAIL